MIITEDQRTIVHFGNKEKANILVSGRYRKLVLQELATNLKIGDSATSEDAHELPKVEVNFSTIESVDVLIAALNHIKNNFTPPDQMYALAC